MLVNLASKLNDKDIEIFTFGKYQNKSVKWVLQTDPNYIKWVKTTNKMFSPIFENEIKRIKLIDYGKEK